MFREHFTVRSEGRRGSFTLNRCKPEAISVCFSSRGSELRNVYETSETIHEGRDTNPETRSSVSPHCGSFEYPISLDFVNRSSLDLIRLQQKLTGDRENHLDSEESELERWIQHRAFDEAAMTRKIQNETRRTRRRSTKILI